MITVSDEWKKIHEKPLLPESFVEVTLEIEDSSASYIASVGCEAAASFSQIDKIAHNRSLESPMYYVTLEENLWSLDGSRQILPEANPKDNTGCVSYDDTIYSGDKHSGIRFKFGVVVSKVNGLGLDITWSSEYGEYPVNFKIEAWRDNTLVGTKIVSENGSVKSHVDYDFVEYNELRVIPMDWNMPNRRFRIDQTYFGQVITFNKTQLLSYTTEQSGDALTSELPRSTLTFVLDNYDGAWDLLNPTGVARHLCEQQRISVRYGFQLDWRIEWIPGGVFYLSEWRSTDNNKTFTFVARDIFGFWGSIYPVYNDCYGSFVKPTVKTGTSSSTGPYLFKTLKALCEARNTGVEPTSADEIHLDADPLVFGGGDILGGRGEYLPYSSDDSTDGVFVYRTKVEQDGDFVGYIDGDCVKMPPVNGSDDFLSYYDYSGETVSHYLRDIHSAWDCRELCDERSMPINRGDRSRSEMIQLASNMCGYMTSVSAEGSLYTGPFWKSITDYTIPKMLAYNNPEIELAKPLKQVRVYHSHDLLIDPCLYEHDVDYTGEVITIDNPYVNQSAWAKHLAELYVEFYGNRVWVSGEFRADPRLELFDIVKVEGEKGMIGWVLITEIKYSYNGSFHGTYKGKLLTDEFIAKVR